MNILAQGPWDTVIVVTGEIYLFNERLYQFAVETRFKVNEKKEG